MKMRIPAVIRRVLIAIVFCCVAGQSFSQTRSEPSARTAQSAPRRQGFLDYALGKVNPHDKDYGAKIESARNAIVGYTIDDLYFWSNVVTLLLLSGLVAIVLFQWRAMDKRELIAASLITRLWNGRVSDRIEIDRRTQQFNQLVEAHNAEAEAALSHKSRLFGTGKRYEWELDEERSHIGGQQRNRASGGGEDCLRRARCDRSEHAAKQSLAATARRSLAEQ